MSGRSYAIIEALLGDKEDTPNKRKDILHAMGNLNAKRDQTIPIDFEALRKQAKALAEEATCDIIQVLQANRVRQNQDTLMTCKDMKATSDHLNEKYGKNVNSRMTMLSEANNENKNFADTFTNISVEQFDLRERICEIEQALRQWSNVFKVSQSTEARAKLIGATEDAVIDHKTQEDERIVNLVQSDVQKQINNLHEQLQNLNEIEGNQAQIENQVQEFITQVSANMQSSLDQAQYKRDKAVSDLESVYNTLDIATVSNSRTIRSNKQLDSTLSRLQTTLTSSEQAYDDMLVMYNSQFQQLTSTIEINTVKMQELRLKQSEVQSNCFLAQIQVQNEQVNVNGLKAERDMRVSLDDQYNINMLMILIEDYMRRADTSTEQCELSVLRWQSRLDDLQRQVVMVHTHTNESLLGSLAARYMSEIDEKNAQICEITKQKNEIESKLRSAVTQDQIKALQGNLQNLIFSYETTIKDRVDMIQEMMRHLKKYCGSQEEKLGAEEDISRLKSAIDLAQRDNNQKIQVGNDLQNQINELIEKDEELGEEITAYDQRFEDMEKKADDDEDLIESLYDQLKDKDSEIEQLKAQWAEMNKPREEVFIQVEEPIANTPKPYKYKAIKGDAVDAMLAKYLNELGFAVPVERVGNNNQYNFGRIKVFMSIKNGNLTVRVGGGYMSIQEFLAQNAESEAEWAKTFNAIDRNGDGHAVISGGGPTNKRQSTMPQTGSRSPRRNTTMH